jgi:thymidine kinase
MKQVLSGSLNLIIGPMYSGKTSTLIIRYNRHTIARRKCIMIKYKHDTRYDDKMIVSHNGIKVQAISCEELLNVDHIVKEYDVICIDEVQFYKDAHIFCDKWANEGLIVEACGLNGTFERKPFNVISLLIPKCNDITYMKSICVETSGEAYYSKRNTNDTEVEVIGGVDMYSAADRKTFFDNTSWKHINFIEFVQYQCDKKDTVMTDNLKQFIYTLSVDDNIDYEKLFDSLES